MGAVIEQVQWVRPNAEDCTPSSVDLASRAAKRTLDAAGCAPNDVGLIVNTGVYRDENICEPAMAPFIQEQIGSNVAPLPAHASRTFSFDVNNGACGFLTGIQLADGFLTSGRIRRGMVVTSDVDPTPDISDGLAFDAAGAAILLSAGAPGEGFVAFHSETFGKYSHLFESHVRWRKPTRGSRVSKTHALRIRQSPHYAAACAQCAGKAVERFLEARGLTVGDVDLIVPAQTPEAFPEALKARLAPTGEPGPPILSSQIRAHTAGIAIALEAELRDERHRRARRILLVAVGSGISVSLALYRSQPARGADVGPQ